MRYAVRGLLLGLFLAGQGCTLTIPSGLLARVGGLPVAVSGSAAPSARPSLTPPDRPASPPPDCHQDFGRFDIDGSGGWDLKEFLAFQAAHPAPAAPCPVAEPTATPRPYPTPRPLPAVTPYPSPVPSYRLPSPSPYPSVRPASPSPFAVPTPTPRPSAASAAYQLTQALPRPIGMMNADPAFPVGAPAPCGQPDPQVVFRLMDANQDGELDEDEVCALLEGGPPAPEPSPEETPGDGDGGLIWHAPTGPVAPGGPRPGPIAID